jgi:hypothetical protein
VEKYLFLILNYPAQVVNVWQHRISIHFLPYSSVSEKYLFAYFPYLKEITRDETYKIMVYLPTGVSSCIYYQGQFQAAVQNDG